MVDKVDVSMKCKCNHGNEGIKCVDCITGFTRVAHKCINDLCVTGSGAHTGVCSWNGQCAFNEGNEYWCECFDGVTGEKCDTCAEGQTKMANGRCVNISCVVDGKECAGHGACI